MPFVNVSSASSRKYDVTIVGSGPAGLAVAKGAADQGLAVLILEQGGRDPSDPQTAIPVGTVREPDRHVAPQVASCQALGGTLHWWGGRSVPLDPVDFSANEAPLWPITFDEYAAWIPEASAFLGVAPGYTRPMPGWDDAPGLSSEMVEHLCSDKSLTSSKIKDAMAQADILLDTCVTALLPNDAGDIASINVRVAGVEAQLPITSLVMCCGGLESTRLLLDLQRRAPTVAGGANGPLGRTYMGHLTASVSTIELANPSDWSYFSYSGAPRPSRRRLMLKEDDLSSARHIGIAFWLENIRGDDPNHGVAIQSLRHLVAWLAGKSKPAGTVGVHLENILAQPGQLVSEAIGLLQRPLKRDDRPADKLRRSRFNRYRVAYHSEHYANPESQVRLSDQTDPNGRPMLDIDFRFAAADFEAIAQAHRSLKARLEASGLAKLTFEDNRLVAQIEESARDGYHQIGMTRMSVRPTDGVVDPNLKVHGVRNLYTVSTGIFPTSGQANPTLSVVCFALRLAAHLGKIHRP